MTEKEWKQILEEGEGYRVEFKEGLSNIDKEMVAFANGSGGRIILGVTDHGEPAVHFRVSNSLKSQVQDIANNCEPKIDIRLEEFRHTLVIRVKEGADKPYKCSSGFYTRIGPNSQKLNRDEIMGLFRTEGKIRFDEMINLRFDYRKHFDPKKLERFLEISNITKILGMPSMLTNLGVGEKHKGRLCLTNTGILFFAKRLEDIYYHTAVTCALYQGSEKVTILDKREFNDDLPGNIEGAMTFLKQHIPIRVVIAGSPRRTEVPDIPYDALREALVNAVAHRDYFEKGATVMVEVFEDRVEITNPGGLVKGLRPEDFGKRSVLRNPNIAHRLHRMGYIERMGTGISRIKALLVQARLPEAQFQFDTFFKVIFLKPRRVLEEGKDFREDFRVNFMENFRVKGRQAERMLGIISILARGRHWKIKEKAREYGVSERTLAEDIRKLQRWEILKFEGPPKTGRYVLTEKGDGMVKGTHYVT